MVQLNPAYGHLHSHTNIPLKRAFSMAPSLSILTEFDSTCDEKAYYMWVPNSYNNFICFSLAVLAVIYHVWCTFFIYYNHFEITSCDHCNLIGYQQCDLFTNHTIFWLYITSVLIRVIYVLNHVISVLNRTIFALHVNLIISVSNTKWDVKTFLFPVFNKTATRSIKYWYCLNAAISKFL